LFIIHRSFYESSPRHLTYIFEELNQPIPPELAIYVSSQTVNCNAGEPGSSAAGGSGSYSFYEPLVVPSPLKHQGPNNGGTVNNRRPPSTNVGEFDESDDEEHSTMSSTSASQRCKKYIYLLIFWH